MLWQVWENVKGKQTNEFTGWETQYLGCIPFGSMVGLMNPYAVGDHGLRLDCPKCARTDQSVLLKKRWMVERTFGWLMAVVD